MQTGDPITAVEYLWRVLGPGWWAVIGFMDRHLKGILIFYGILLGLHIFLGAKWTARWRAGVLPKKFLLMQDGLYDDWFPLQLLLFVTLMLVLSLPLPLIFVICLHDWPPMPDWGFAIMGIGGTALLIGVIVFARRRQKITPPETPVGAGPDFGAPARRPGFSLLVLVGIVGILLLLGLSAYDILVKDHWIMFGLLVTGIGGSGFYFARKNRPRTESERKQRELEKQQTLHQFERSRAAGPKDPLLETLAPIFPVLGGLAVLAFLGLLAAGGKLARHILEDTPPLLLGGGGVAILIWVILHTRRKKKLAATKDPAAPPDKNTG